MTGQYDVFENMNKGIILLKEEDNNEISELAQKYLISLWDQLCLYFPDINEFNYQLIQNPFQLNPRSLSDNLQDEFVEFLNDSVSKALLLNISQNKVLEHYG